MMEQISEIRLVTNKDGNYKTLSFLLDRYNLKLGDEVVFSQVDGSDCIVCSFIHHSDGVKSS